MNHQHDSLRRLFKKLKKVWRKDPVIFITLALRLIDLVLRIMFH